MENKERLDKNRKALERGDIQGIKQWRAQFNEDKTSEYNKHIGASLLRLEWDNIHNWRNPEYVEQCIRKINRFNLRWIIIKNKHHSIIIRNPIY